MIKSFWHQSSNVGDAITPYILEKLSIPFQYTDWGIKEEHYIMCGSILPASNEHTIVWGAGIAQDAEDIIWTQPKQICAVRGHLTRRMLLSKGIDCPKVYGDPAMILPLLYSPKIEKKHYIGFVPHIIDRHLFTDFIDITQPVEKFIDSILECETIVSSSLHALIIADAYGVKFKWVSSPNVIGGDFKYRDFLDTHYDKEKFIQSFPFKEQLNNYKNDN
jgi:pyruvyltransferase